MRPLLAIVLALTAAGVACGSDKKATPAPESLRAPAAQVAGGLHAIDALSQKIAAAAATDAKKAKALTEGIEPAWQPIEGTIRANDKDNYLRFEDAFAALGKAAGAGDGPKAEEQATDIADAVKVYLQTYPG
jgi:hypothetical protein